MQMELCEGTLHDFALQLVRSANRKRRSSDGITIRSRDGHVSNSIVIGSGNCSDSVEALSGLSAHLEAGTGGSDPNNLRATPPGQLLCSSISLELDGLDGNSSSTDNSSIGSGGRGGAPGTGRGGCSSARAARRCG